MTRIVKLIGVFLLLMGGVGFGRTQPTQAAPSRTFIVNSAIDAHDPVAGNGLCGVTLIPSGVRICSLRAAVEEANALPGPDVITFADGIDSDLTLGTLTIVDDVTIIGNAETATSDRTRIQGMVAGSGVFYIDVLPTVHIENVHIRRPVNNMWWQSPACIFNNGTLSLQGVQIQFCQGTSGAIHSETGSINSSASLSMVYTEIFDNLGIEGGAVKSLNADLAIHNSSLRDNVARDGSGTDNPRGGNVYFKVDNGAQGVLTITSSEILNGRITDGAALDGQGGSIYLVDNNFNTTTHFISQSSVSDSRAASGGAIYTRAGDLQIVASQIDSNLAVAGAGLYLGSSSGATIERSTFSNGIATSGGAVYMEGIGVRGNSAEPTGASDELIIANSTLSWNEASRGSAIYLDGTARLTHVTITKGWVSATDEESSGAIHANPFDLRRGISNLLYVENSVVGDQRRGKDCHAVSMNEAGSSAVNVDSDGSCPGFSSSNPSLEPLSNNGGLTKTHAHSSTGPEAHPLQNIGEDTACAAAGNIDQRGYGRPGGGACDVGAFEASGVPTAVSVQANSAESLLTIQPLLLLSLPLLLATIMIYKETS